MTEDKDIEAIRKIIWNFQFYIKNDTYPEISAENVSSDILGVLTSLGYVKLAEQKLPPRLRYNSFTNPNNAFQEAQQDMLSVDSEGCAYRRVRIK